MAARSRLRKKLEQQKKKLDVNRPPGELRGRDELPEFGSGTVTVTCGLTGAEETLEVAGWEERGYDWPRATLTLMYQDLRSAGWQYTHLWGYVRREAYDRLQRAIRAGHVQLELV